MLRIPHQFTAAMARSALLIVSVIVALPPGCGGIPPVARFWGGLAFTSDRDGNWEIYTMDPDGSNQRRLTNNSAEDVEPSWSPDGTRIAFDTDRDGNNEIYVMNLDGSNQKNLSNYPGDNFDPSWSPDGKKIACESDRDGNGEIYVMNADGSNPTRLTTSPGWDGSPAWSPR